MNLWRILLLLLLLFSFRHASQAADPSINPTPVLKTITHQKMQRSYWVDAPFEPGKERHPVFVMLHGGGGTGRGFDRLTLGELHRIAVKDKIIMVYPEGYRKQWNDKREASAIVSQALNIDDVGFLTKVIENTLQAYQGDPKRVYVAGISNGGMMSNTLACELSGKIAAIGVVAAGIPEKVSKNCNPPAPVSVIMFNGTDDPIVPYQGGGISIGRQKRGTVMSAEQSAAFWARKNGITGEPQSTLLPDKAPKDGTRITRTVYAGIKADVVQYKVEGGGHTWPSGKPYFPERIIGKVSYDMDATSVMKDFFLAHPKKN